LKKRYEKRSKNTESKLCVKHYGEWLAAKFGTLSKAAMQMKKVL
jgi:hypothetical protein